MQHLSLFFFLLFSCTLASHATELVTLKAANGTEIEIYPLCFDSPSQTVAFANRDKEISSAPLNHFHANEHAKLSLLIPDHSLLNQWSQSIQPEPEAFPPVPPKGWQLVGWDKGNRANIQSFNQRDYGNKTSDCLPNSLINTLQWWHEQNFVEFPKKRTSEKQVDWFHKEISRAAGTRNNSGTYWNDLRHAMFRFSKKHLNGDYLFACFQSYTLTPAKLTHYCNNSTAAILSLSIYNGRKYNGGHAVTLISAKPNGRIKINTWGLKLSCELVPLEKQLLPRSASDNTTQYAQAYELEFFNKNELPSYFADSKIRFIIAPKHHDCLIMFLPYQRQKSGVTWLPHPETSTFVEPLVPEPVELKEEVFLHGTAAVTDFTRPPAPMTRSWESAEGKKLHSTLVQVDGDDTVHFKNGHQSAQVPMQMLSPEDQARAAFWRSSTGPKFTLPAATLCYSFRPTNHAKSTPLKILIHYDGSNKATMEIPDYNRELRYDSALGKLEVYDMQSGKVVLLANCAFHKTLKGIEHLNFSDFKEWSPKTLRGYAYRTTKVPHFPTGNTCCANVAANPVTELLGYLLGWSVTRDSGGKRVSEDMVEVFSTSQIYSKRAELTSNLEIARHWELLPTKVVWSGFTHKSNGSLQLVSVVLKDDSDLPMTHSESD